VNLKRTYKRGIGRVYVDNNNREYPSVTTILGSTLATGPWLDTWKDKMRREKFHEQYEIRALEQGDGRVDVYDVFDESLAYPNVYRNSKGDLGTFYHKVIEAYLNAEPVESYVRADKRVESVLKSISEWEEKMQLVPVKVEHYIASKKYGYAGTIDLVAEQTIDGRKQLVLIDFKTGSTRDDQLMQLAAYSMAYHEEYGKRPNLCFFVKVDVEKSRVTETGHLHYHEISEVFDVFLAAFKLWTWRSKWPK
jgi:PD-(D/E)XK nuclease superfamily